MTQYSAILGQPHDHLFIVGPFFMHFKSALIYKVYSGNLTSFSKKHFALVNMKALAMNIYRRKLIL